MMEAENISRSDMVGAPLNGGGQLIAYKDGFGVAVEINLRLPSMLHGKKGFERIVWAFKNVLNNSVTWLFYDYATQDNGMSICKVTP